MGQAGQAVGGAEGQCGDGHLDWLHMPQVRVSGIILQFVSVSHQFRQTMFNK
jgi:hypothetical protein